MTPYFSTFQEFLHMGGHGFYVWFCYALVITTTLALVLHARRERAATLKQLTKQQNRLTNKQRKQS